MALDAARDIVRTSGIEGLTARRVAQAIGYTPGTLYQHFSNMDALVQEMNAETLRALLASCPDPWEGESVEDRLMALAVAFTDFARSNSEEWRSVIAFPYSPEHEWSDAYNLAVGELIGLLTSATATLYGPGEEATQAGEVRVLWAGLFGLFVLESHGRLGTGVRLLDQTKTLISFYLAKRGKD